MAARALFRTAATPLEARFFLGGHCFALRPSRRQRHLFSSSGGQAPYASSVDAFNAELEHVFGTGPRGGGGGDTSASSFSHPPSTRLTAAGAIFEGDSRAGAGAHAGEGGPLAELLDGAPLELFLLLVEKGALEWPSGRHMGGPPVELAPREVARMPGVTPGLLRRLHALSVIA